MWVWYPIGEANENDAANATAITNGLGLELDKAAAWRANGNTIAAAPLLLISSFSTLSSGRWLRVLRELRRVESTRQADWR